MWNYLGSAEDIPTDCDLRLVVMDAEGMHELVFACRRIGKSFVDAKTQRLVDVRPTHWQLW